MKVKFLIIAGLVLFGAVWLQTRGEFQASGDPTPDLQKMLSAETPGWESRDMPIGENEGVTRAAEKTLRYDAYFFRSYRQGSLNFSLYVAYWRPGKQPPQLITQHVPDRCWTMNGMTCEEARHNITTSIGRVTLWPAQWRKFCTPRGEVTYTMYWHLVGGRVYDFGEHFYDVPAPITFWTEAVRFFVGLRPKQYFVRITSSVPPEQIWMNDSFQTAIRGLLQIGLGRTAPNNPE